MKTTRLRIEQAPGSLWQLVDRQVTAHGLSATDRTVLCRPTYNKGYVVWCKDELVEVCGRGRAYSNSKILAALHPGG